MSTGLAAERFVLEGHGLSARARAGSEPVATLVRRFDAFALGRSAPAIFPVRACLPALDLTVLDPQAQMPLESMPQEREPAVAQRAVEIPHAVRTRVHRDESQALPSMMRWTEPAMDEAAERVAGQPVAQSMAELVRFDASLGNVSAGQPIAKSAAVERGEEVVELPDAAGTRAVPLAAVEAQPPIIAERSAIGAVPLVDSRDATPLSADARVETVSRLHARQTVPSESMYRLPSDGMPSAGSIEHPRNRSVLETPRVPAHEITQVSYMGQPAAPPAAAAPTASPLQQKMVERLVVLGAGQERHETLRIDSVQVVVRSAPSGRQRIAPSPAAVAPAASAPAPLSEFRSPWLSNRRYD